MNHTFFSDFMAGFIITLVIICVILTCCVWRCRRKLARSAVPRYSSPIVVTSTETRQASRPFYYQTQIISHQNLPQNTHRQPMPMPLPQYGFQVNSSTCPYPIDHASTPPYPVYQQQPSAPYPTLPHPAQQNPSNSTRNEDDLPPSFDEVMANPKYSMSKK